jgi:uncharacterized protein DUF3592
MEGAGWVVLVVAALLVAVGLALLAAGTRTRAAARRFDARAVRVPGVVVELRLARGYRGPGDVSSGFWVPVLEFTTADGRPIRTAAMYGSVPAPARPGDRVQVVYDPDQPTRAQVADRHLASGGCLAATTFAVGLALAVLGGLLGVVAVLVLANA